MNVAFEEIRKPLTQEGCFMAYNKSDLVSKIAQKSNLTKAQAEAAVNAFQDVFVESMHFRRRSEADGSVLGGACEVAPQRTGRNPRTGETIKIPASYGVRITAGSLLKKAVAE
jgi:DNA-binding protein HU-beta